LITFQSLSWKNFLSTGNIKNEKMAKKKRSKLEQKLDEINHQMELVRTIVPIAILIIQIIILFKLFG